MISDQIDQLFSQETVEQPQTLIFNKLTGVLVAKMMGDNLSLVNTKYCKGKVISYNPDTHEYIGNYDSGSVQSKATRPRVASEMSLDDTAGLHIRKKYNYHHQLNHIIDMMKLLLDASSLTDEQKANFNAMKEYIDEIRDLNKKYKDSYANDPNWDYKTRQDVLDEIDDKLAGGMAEEVHSEADVTGLQKLGGRLGA
tara:strand:- start:1043 stop:1633 length:591 start_codon:yes stop_codon:yes gene_type:complete